MKAFLLLLLSSMLMACEQAQLEAVASEPKGMPDPLIVVTRNAPTTWFEGRDGPAGMEHDLIESFALSQQVEVRFVIKDSIAEVLDFVKQGKAHIAAAGLTKTELRQQHGYEFGPEYFTVQQQVVCRRNSGGIPDDLQQLVGKTIEVIADSSYVERLNELKQQIPELQWTEVDDMGTEQLLEKVWNKQIDCTVADSNIVDINRRYYPELVVAFPISEDQPLSWIINSDWKHLSKPIEQWLQSIEENGDLATINERYYGHVELYDYVDMRKFINRIDDRLTKYTKQFQTAAKEHDLDWILLAAQSYQESHWNPRAKSPTGVRGMMMLTLNTSKAMGVTNRLDPEQSIQGGAKYLARMLSRVPDSVEGENRLWMALAAYNVGFGHLRDARKLAVKLGKDADNWAELKQVLPLLSQKKYYKDLKYGYARGSEPVTYVQRIRDYQQVLIQQIETGNIKD